MCSDALLQCARRLLTGRAYVGRSVLLSDARGQTWRSKATGWQLHNKAAERGGWGAEQFEVVTLAGHWLPDSQVVCRP
jgi:hypothetical protein